MSEVRLKVRTAGNKVRVKRLKPADQNIHVRTSQNIAKVTAVVAGPRGPRGPSGAEGSDKTFEQAFTIQSSVTVNHNLGKYPAVTVMNSAKDEVEGHVRYTDLNSLVVSFSAPFSGKVICN